MIHGQWWANGNLQTAQFRGPSSYGWRLPLQKTATRAASNPIGFAISGVVNSSCLTSCQHASSDVTYHEQRQSPITVIMIVVLMFRTLKMKETVKDYNIFRGRGGRKILKQISP